jgi:hypothetical protein
MMSFVPQYHEQEELPPPLDCNESVMTKSMASTLPTYDDPALRYTTKHNNNPTLVSSPTKSYYSNIKDRTTSSKSSSSPSRRRWHPFRRLLLRKQKLSMLNKSSSSNTTDTKGRKKTVPVLPLQQFLDVSEPPDVTACSVAPLMLMEQHLTTTIADGTIPGQTLKGAATTKSQELAFKFLEQERKKQRQALYDKERDERQEQERIARLKQEALDRQRKLQLELELERASKGVDIAKQQQQEQQQEAQGELERERQQHDTDLLAQELAEELQRDAEAELEYQEQMQELKQETASLKHPQQQQLQQQRPPLASRKSLAEKLKVLDGHHSRQKTKSIFDDLVLPRSMSSRNSVASCSVGPEQSTAGISVLSAGTSVLAPCTLCETGERTHISMPCMHYMFCQSCVEDLHQRDVTICPVCETEQVAFTLVNLS